MATRQDIFMSFSQSCRKRGAQLANNRRQVCTECGVVPAFSLLVSLLLFCLQLPLKFPAVTPQSHQLQNVLDLGHFFPQLSFCLRQPMLPFYKWQASIGGCQLYSSQHPYSSLPEVIPFQYLCGHLFGIFPSDVRTNWIPDAALRTDA